MANPRDPDPYEVDNYDQDPNEGDGNEKDTGGYESFLAPKSAFPDLEVGQIHKVKVDRILADEVEMHCVKGEGNADTSDTEPEEDEAYT